MAVQPARANVHLHLKLKTVIFPGNFQKFTAKPIAGFPVSTNHCLWKGKHKSILQ